MKDTMSVVKERYPGIAKRREAVAESGGLVELPDDFDADGMGLAAGTARLRGLDTYGTRAPAAPSAQPRRGAQPRSTLCVVTPTWYGNAASSTGGA